MAPASAWDGFHAGIGLVLTVLKVWLAAAFCLTLAIGAAAASPLLAAGLAAASLALAAPFIRLGWIGQLRAGLAGDAAAVFRTGLVAALCTAILLLWIAMTVFAALTTGLAPGGVAAVPLGLNVAAGTLALASTLLGAAALARLRTTPR